MNSDPYHRERVQSILTNWEVSLAEERKVPVLLVSLKPGKQGPLSVSTYIGGGLSNEGAVELVKCLYKLLDKMPEAYKTGEKGGYKVKTPGLHEDQL